MECQSLPVYGQKEGGCLLWGILLFSDHAIPLIVIIQEADFTYIVLHVVGDIVVPWWKHIGLIKYGNILNNVY